jgi:hypothetical protein
MERLCENVIYAGAEIKTLLQYPGVAQFSSQTQDSSQYSIQEQPGKGLGLQYIGTTVIPENSTLLIGYGIGA